MINMRYDTPLYQINNLRDFRPLMDKRFIMFGTGKFDDFCAWFGRFDASLGDQTIMCGKPLDVHYFDVVRFLGEQYGIWKVYQDILHFYEHTGKIVDDRVINEILNISLSYGNNVDFAYNAFMQIYYGMIAEENKENTRLGKLIKMNGLYRVLMERVPVDIAATECCGQSYVDIANECDMRNIRRFIP